jgi:peptidyl-dipeptidase A
VAIRNREARRLGYDNFYSMSLRLQELDEDSLFTLLEQVSSDLEPTFLPRKERFDGELARRYGVAPSELRPWHYSDPFFQEAPSAGDDRLDKLFVGGHLEEKLTQFFDAIGLDIHTLLPHADLYEKPGKNQHAYCLSVGRGTGDVRVSCNLRPDAKWMATLLHEFGHAVYDNEIDSALPFFLKTVSHIMTTEAVAELMGRFVTNGAWLARWAGVPSDRAAEIADAARDTQQTQMLVFTQWVQVITHFERELYRNPEQDLDALWWDLVARYQRLTPPDNAPPSAWASKIHLSTSPVYYHNYLMGEMIASQILHTLRTRVVAGDEELVGSPEVGAWLIDNVFRPGARYAWNDLVARATGEPLNPEYFVREMSAEV